MCLKILLCIVNVLSCPYLKQKKKDALPPKSVKTKHHVYEACIFSWPKQILITVKNHSGWAEKEKRSEDLKKARKT